MEKAEVLSKIRDVGVMPVIRAESADEAARMIDAIVAGGVPVLEITMTVPGAVELIAEVARRVGSDAVVGAGTVLDAETAEACIDAGARFVVSPALDLAMVSAVKRRGVAVIPGALTPTEVVTAFRAGADIVKIFPASAAGGPSYLKALKAPLPHIELCPTGGVTLENAGDFIRAGASLVGVGADLVDVRALRAGQVASITAKAKAYVYAVRAARNAR
jgi:2-dehydro-3-deoxyphosphogluconate aldolase/(4S)-4-hydroxy-2-oxoglutarate aldolase